MANFPSGVTYQRGADWVNHVLLGTDGVTAVSPSIDPFFFQWSPLDLADHARPDHPQGTSRSPRTGDHTRPDHPARPDHSPRSNRSARANRCGTSRRGHARRRPRGRGRSEKADAANRSGSVTRAASPLATTDADRLPEVARPGRAERVLLVSMPFGALERPSLALGLLQAHCCRLGVACETRYLNFPFAERIGQGDYLWLCSDDVPYTAFVGDWLFGEALYGGAPGRRCRLSRRGAAAHMADGRGQPRPADADPQARRAVPRSVPAHDRVARLHLRRLHVGVPAERRVAGARRAGQARRARHHDRLRRRELGRRDGSRAAGAVPLRRPGVLGRGRRIVSRGARGATKQGQPRRHPRRQRTGTTRRRATARPRASSTSTACRYRTSTPSSRSVNRAAWSAWRRRSSSETARGCWWGERQHCTFCGLNGATMAFRSKTPERVLVGDRGAARSARRPGVQHRRQHPRHALLPHRAADARGGGPRARGCSGRSRRTCRHEPGAAAAATPASSTSSPASRASAITC